MLTKPVSGPSWGTILSGKLENETKIYSNEIVENSSFSWKVKNIFTALKNIKNISIISKWKGMINLVKDSQTVIAFQNEDYKFTDQKALNACMEKLIENNEEDNVFLFNYINGIDLSGHKYGFSIQSKEYIDYIEMIDYKLYDILNYAKNNDWHIIITTDHGGVFSELTSDQQNKYNNYYGKEKGVHGLNIIQHTQTFQIIMVINFFKEITTN